MKLKRLSKAHKNWKMYSYHSTLRGTTRQNPEESSQNDPGVSEALKTLTLSLGTKIEMACHRISDSLDYTLFANIFSTSLLGQGVVVVYVYRWYINNKSRINRNKKEIH